MRGDLGWTRAELTGAFSLALLAWASRAWAWGGWLDRHGGPRWLMTVGAAIARGAAGRGLVGFQQPGPLLRIFGSVSASPWRWSSTSRPLTSWRPGSCRPRAAPDDSSPSSPAWQASIYIPRSRGSSRTYGWRQALVAWPPSSRRPGDRPPHARPVLRRRPEDLGLYPTALPTRPTPLTAAPDEASVPAATAIRRPPFAG